MLDEDVDVQLKAKHAAMWASGDYPAMVEAFLLPLGPPFVAAAGIGPGQRVLDVAAGTGNASLEAARTGADVTASDLTAELLEVGERRAQQAGLSLAWRVADAEALPVEDASFDVVMSSIGVMFAPHHERAAGELARVCRRGGTVALMSWTPEGMIGALFRAMRPFAPPPPPGAQPPPLWGSEEHLTGLFGDRVEWTSMTRDVLAIDAFPRAEDYAACFLEQYGPTISTRAHARSQGREEEFLAAFHAFVREWDLGDASTSRFEQEYLLSVGTRC